MLVPLSANLKNAGTHAELPSIFDTLGLPVTAGEGSKRDRIVSSFNALIDADLFEITPRYLKRYPPSTETRNAIQDILSEEPACLEIPKCFRREWYRR